MRLSYRGHLGRALRLAWMLFAAAAVLMPVNAAAASPHVEQADLNGDINNIMAAYIERGRTGQGTTAPGLQCDAPADPSTALECSGFLASSLDGTLLDVTVRVSRGAGPHGSGRCLSG